MTAGVVDRTVAIDWLCLPGRYSEHGITGAGRLRPRRFGLPAVLLVALIDFAR